MERKEITEYSKDQLELNYCEDLPLADLHKWLEKVKDYDGADLHVERDYDGDIESIHINAYRKRLETPAEASKRINEQNAEEAERLQRERNHDIAEFEKLKKKLGK